MLLILVIMSGCAKNTEPTVESIRSKYHITVTSEDTKVIVDTDLVYLNDDVFALFGYLKADQAGYIDVLGVTTVGANSFVVPETYDVLNILDYLDRSDISVAMGVDVPMNGFVDLEEIYKDIGKMDYIGAYKNMEHYPSDYSEAEKLATSRVLGDPTSLPIDQTATDFMIEQVHKYPGKVTIIALGACTNVAEAIKKDPQFVEFAAGIIYMGGTFDVPGETLPASEYNWWYDPHAVNICIKANWKSQIVVPHDVATRCLKGKDVYELYKKNNTTKITQLITDYLAPTYENGKTEDLLFCWDPITVATLIAPSLVTQRETRDIVMQDTMGYTYGSSFSWKEANGPNHASTVDLILDVDRDGFWKFMSQLYTIPD